MAEKEKKEKAADNERDFRLIIAKIVLPASIGGVLVLAIALAIIALVVKNDEDMAKWVMAAVLPVMGTWVGTILAYYFAKENFEAASRNVAETAERLTGIEKLKSVMVKEKYIAKKDMVSIQITKSNPESSVMLVDGIIKTLEDNGRNRLPVLNEENHPKYIIHRSMIDKYLIGKTTKGNKTAQDIGKLTLQTLLDEDKETKILFQTGFGLVKEDATMADAKIEMDRVKGRLDVFVTSGGKEDEPVIGWLTNLIITECAKV